MGQIVEPEPSSPSPGGGTLPHRPLNTRARVRPSRPSRSGRCWRTTATGSWTRRPPPSGRRPTAIQTRCASGPRRLPPVLPHLRMLPAILRMIVPAVSDESRAGGTHGREPAARRFTLDRKHAAARGVLRSRVRQSAASRESSWTAGTPPSKPGRKAHNCYRSRGAGGVSPVDAALDAALPTVGHLTMHHQLHPFTRPPPAGSSRGRTGVRGVPRSVT